MADEQARDNYDFVLDDCRISSSQEELLSDTKFAREDEVFPDDDVAVVPEAAEGSRRILEVSGGCGGGGGDGGDGSGGGNDGGENLGFQGERKRDKEEESCGEERGIKPESKKSKVSPLVGCSRKGVSEDDEGGGKGKVVEIGSSSRPVVVPEDGGCTEKMDLEGFEGDGGGGGGGVGEGKENESGVKRKLELVMDTEVINVNDEDEGKEGIEGGGEGSRKREGKEVEGGGMSVRGEGEEGANRRGKRELPPSMFGLVWSEGSEFRNRNGNGDEDKEGGLKETSEEEKKDEESNKVNEDVAFKCTLDVLRMIVASEDCSNDSGKIDLLETAKQHGVTFPRSRFLPEVGGDD